MQLYNLNAVVDKVARYDPVTNRKNKLRKSYKGFIGGISGRHEVVAKPSKPDQQFFDNTDLVENKLQWLSFYPEDEWRNQCVLGKELSRGLDLGKLKRGLSGITKGDIPGVRVFYSNLPRFLCVAIAVDNAIFAVGSCIASLLTLLLV